MINKYSSFDNYYLEDMLDSLYHGTTLDRYLDLKDSIDVIYKTLNEKGIVRKDDFNLDDFEQTIMWKKFYFFIHLYDFIPRSLKDIREVNPSLIDSLINSGIINSGTFLSLYDKKRSEFDKYRKEEIDYIADLLNLMRLPGVKYTRAKLYYDSGFRNIMEFFDKDADEVVDKVSKFIKDNNREEQAPFKKEAATHIAVSRMIIGMYR